MLTASADISACTAQLAASLRDSSPVMQSPCATWHRCPIQRNVVQSDAHPRLPLRPKRPPPAHLKSELVLLLFVGEPTRSHHGVAQTAGPHSSFAQKLPLQNPACTFPQTPPLKFTPNPDSNSLFLFFFFFFFFFSFCFWPFLEHPFPFPFLPPYPPLPHR